MENAILEILEKSRDEFSPYPTSKRLAMALAEVATKFIGATQMGLKIESLSQKLTASDRRVRELEAELRRVSPDPAFFAHAPIREFHMFDMENLAKFTVSAAQMDILFSIGKERGRQDVLKAEGKFSRTCSDKMSEPERLAVLAEEFGEVARHVAEGLATGNNEAEVAGLEKELIQVAAVCVAWVEGLHKEENSR
jgi:hypothetical protein